MLTGAREVAAARLIRAQAADEVISVVTTAERDIAWFIADADREPGMTGALIDAARRGVTVNVVTAAGRERRLDFRNDALARLRDAGAAIFTKSPLRESLLVVDRQVTAVQIPTLDGWSVWRDAGVAAHVARAHQAQLLLELASQNAGGGCSRCGKVIGLYEGDHARPGVYAVCTGCGRSVKGRRDSRSYAAGGR